MKKVLGVLATIDQQGEQAAIEAEEQQALMQQAHDKIKALQAKHVFMEKALQEQQLEKEAKAFEVQQLRNELTAFSVGSGIGLRKQRASAVSLFQGAPTQEEQDQKQVKQAKVKELEEASVKVSTQIIQMEEALKQSTDKLQEVTNAFGQMQEQNQKLEQEKTKLAAAKKESDVALDAFKAGFENMTKEEMEALKTEIEAQETGQVVPVAESDDQKTITFDDIKRLFLRFLVGTKKINPTVQS